MKIVSMNLVAMKFTNISPYYLFFFIILYLRIIYTLWDVILDTEFRESWIYIHKIELRFAQFRLVVSMKRGHV